MAFLGFSVDVRDEINRWNLSRQTLETLLLSLMPLVDGSPIDVPQDGDGMWFACDFEDPEREGHHYYFHFRLSRDDSDYWVSQLNATRYDGDDHLVWAEDAPPE